MGEYLAINTPLLIYGANSVDIHSSMTQIEVGPTNWMSPSLPCFLSSIAIIYKQTSYQK